VDGDNVDMSAMTQDIVTTGDITGDTITANTDIILGGNSLTTTINNITS
jgi:hypothetical protein